MGEMEGTQGTHLKEAFWKRNAVPKIVSPSHEATFISREGIWLIDRGQSRGEICAIILVLLIKKYYSYFKISCSRPEF